MREFNLDLLIGKDVVVNCKTIEEEQEFLKYLKDKGFKWCSGIEIFSHNYYNYKEYDKDTCFDLTKNGLQYSPVDYYKSEDFKILSLNDLVIKPKKNFNDYGFEADFEGEILKEYENQFVGMVYQNEANFGCSWDKKGRCLQPNGFGYINMNLKPIKKWYENPDNFPCIVISLKTNKPHIAYNYNHLEVKIKQETFSAKPDKFRPATKEEVLALLIKE